MKNIKSKSLFISLLLLFVVVVSVSSTFAADTSDVIAVDDELDEDVIAADVADEEPILQDESPVVTKDNFHDYFDQNGWLTSDADELVFEGNFSGLDVDAISVGSDKPVKFTGKGATFKNTQFMIMQNDVTIDGFNFVTDDANEHTRLIYIANNTDVLSNIVISNNNISFIGPKESEAYAIYAGADDGSKTISGLQIINNNITYVGNSDGTATNNVIRVNGDGDFYKKSENISVQGNTFDVQIPAMKINSFEWAKSFLSDVIVFSYCDDVKFIDNRVDVKFNNTKDSRDGINVVCAYGYDGKNRVYSSNVLIERNEINGEGNGTIEGIRILADGFDIKNNTIDLKSNVYANGIVIEGPSFDGLVSYNRIYLDTPTDVNSSVYGICTLQNKNVVLNVTYKKNVVMAEGYLSCGMNINHIDPVITGNTLALTGNLTHGISATVKTMEGDIMDKFDYFATISDNMIVCLGNNVGNFEEDSILEFPSVGISTVGNASISNNDIYSTCVGIISVDEGNVLIGNNTVEVNSNENDENYVIKVDGVGSLTLNNNNITCDIDDDVICHAVRVSYMNNVSINKNNLQILRGDSTIIMGVVIDHSKNVIFNSNIVNIANNDFSTESGHGGVCGVDFRNSNNASITNNDIVVQGVDEVYGLKVSGDNFTVKSNVIDSRAEGSAGGIFIEAPADGKIVNNTINAQARVGAIPIFVSTYNQPVFTNITNNKITGGASVVYGIKLIKGEANIENNTIDVVGNFTNGIQSEADQLIVNNNNITSNASNKGEADIFYGNENKTAGILVLEGNATISNNNVQTTGDYAVDLGNANAVVKDNYLLGKKAFGDNSVVNGNDVTVSGGSPAFKTILAAVEFYTTYQSGDIYYVIALDENGNPIKNATILLTVNGKVVNETTDQYGVAAFVVDEWDVGDYPVTLSYNGNKTYAAKSTTGFISVEQRVSSIVAPKSVNVLLTEVKKGSYYAITLKDDRGNGLDGEKVTITFNGKTQTYTTDGLGVIKFKLSATKVGTQKLTAKFDSNGNYVASTLTATVKITKEATKLSANKKTFKAKTKVKKYSVVLKDSKGKAIKKAKVSIKVGKKTFKATTNSKGKATFNIKKVTKRSTYKAKVRFAGNGLYNAVTKTVKITVKK